jgi:hypothetical protein
MRNQRVYLWQIALRSVKSRDLQNQLCDSSAKTTPAASLAMREIGGSAENMERADQTVAIRGVRRKTIDVDRKAGEKTGRDQQPGEDGERKNFSRMR